MKIEQQTANVRSAGIVKRNSKRNYILDMKQIVTIIFLVLGNSAIGQPKLNTDSITVVEPIHQLRIYEVPKENEQVFHERFRDHAYRIMKKYNFKIVSMWKSEFNNKAEFIYLLEWENESIMKSAWAEFMADQEWKDIKAETAKIHGKFVNNIQDRTLLLTDYSPRKLLSPDR